MKNIFLLYIFLISINLLANDSEFYKLEDENSLTYKLNINTNIDDVEIYVDDVKADSNIIKLHPGLHNLSIYKEGYETKKARVDIQSNLYLDIRLIKDKNYVAPVVYTENENSSEIWSDPDTNYIWQVNVSDKAYTFDEAQEYCQNLTIDDKQWRTPTRDELKSILSNDSTAHNTSSSKKVYIKEPLINGTLDKTYLWFWTSESEGEKGVYVNFGYNYDSTYKKSLSNYVRCIASSETQNTTKVDTDNSSNIWIDSDSGLMWQNEKYTDTEKQEYDNRNISYQKVAIWDNAKTYCNNLSLAGYIDWRLPTKDELLGLVDDRVDSTNGYRYFIKAPLANNMPKPDGKRTFTWFWSSTEYNNERAADVYFFYDGKSYNEMKNSPGYIRCVRDTSKKVEPSTYSLTVNPTPSDAKVYIMNIKPKYVDGIKLSSGDYRIKVVANGYKSYEKTITLTGDIVLDIVLEKNSNEIWKDPITNLVWQKFVPKDMYNWEQSKEYCQNLSLAGYSDWRLPTETEFKSIASSNAINNPSSSSKKTYIKGELYNNTMGMKYQWFWTTNQENSSKAIYFNFGYNYSSSYKKTISNSIRCVRGNNY